MTHDASGVQEERWQSGYPDKDREIYPAAPLRFVAFELTFPPVPSLQDETAKREIYARLRGTFPIPAATPASMGGFSLQLSPTGVAAPAPLRAGSFAGLATGLRMMNRDRTASATLNADSILVETSAYVRYEDFREMVRVALEALVAVEELPGVQRIGLRYIDEVRIPEVERPADWAPYVAPCLQGPVSLINADAKVTQGLVEYQLAEQRALILRYGATSGWSVDPNGPLRLKSAASGPYFLLDIDSFWSSLEDLVPEFSLDVALTLCNELHLPVRQVFEAAITDKLRNDVLRKDPV